MIKKTITYVDFNDKSRTEDFYFNLTRGELIELEMGQTGGRSFSDHLMEISASNDNKRILETFKDILRMSYGVKSEDGKRFVKTPELFAEFTQSEAYSEFLLELLSNGDAAAQFVNGLVRGLSSTKTPAELARERSEAQLQGHKTADHVGSDIREVPELPTAAPVLEPQEVQPQQLKKSEFDNLSNDELRALLAERNQGSGYINAPQQ